MNNWFFLGQYEGHKWNLKTLWRYFDEELSVDWRPVWDEIKSVCVKTVLTGREEILGHVHQQLGQSGSDDCFQNQDANQCHRIDFQNRGAAHTQSCFKLFGFDVMLDEKIKPWLLEVNNIPSLHINTIDAAVNRPMVAEMFNIVGLKLPRSMATKHGLSVEGHLPNSERSNDLPNDLLCDDLSPADLQMLAESEDELSQCDQWTRIFPTHQSEHLLQFYSNIPHSDELIQSWEVKYGGSKEDREIGRQIIRKKIETQYQQ